MSITSAQLLDLMPPGPARDSVLSQLGRPKLDPRPVALRKPSHVKGEMNKTEQAYASQLEAMKFNKEIEWYGFEVRTLELAPKTTYTPDFWVILPGGEQMFVEVKGYERDDAVVKFKVAARLYPYARFLMVRKGKGGKWKTLRDIPASSPKGGAK